MAADAIASNLFAQVDQDGKIFVLFDENIYWRTDASKIKLEDAFIHISNINKRRREKTTGKYVSNGRMVAPHEIR